MNIGDAIREFRTDQKMSQSELAKKAGLSRVSIGNYERGTRNPKAIDLGKIAAALNVSGQALTNYDSYKENIQRQVLLRENLAVMQRKLYDLAHGNSSGERSEDAERIRNKIEDVEVDLFKSMFIQKDGYSFDLAPTVYEVHKDIDNLLEGLPQSREELATLRKQLTESEEVGNKGTTWNSLSGVTYNDLKKTTWNDLMNKHFTKLNPTGQAEAVKRVEELTQIEKYTKKED